MSDQGYKGDKPEVERKHTTSGAGVGATGSTIGGGAGTSGAGGTGTGVYTVGDRREETWRDRPGAGHHEDSPYGGPDYGAHRSYTSYNGERSIIATLRGLAADIGLLARQEAQLARTEIGEKIDQAKRGIVEAGMGAALAFAGFLFVLGGIMFALNLALERMWLSALIVGLVVHLIGLALLAAARKNLDADNLKPKRSARSLREDADMARGESRRTHV